MMARLSTLLLLLFLASPALADRALVLESIRVESEGGSEHAVRRLLRLSPGDELHPLTLSEAQRRLESSGLFREVHVYSERGSEAGGVVVVVDAPLDRGVQLLTGFGHEPIGGWYLDVLGLRWNNPVRRGGHLDFGFRLGQRKQGLIARWEVPQVLGPGDLLVDAFAGGERWRIHEDESVYNQRIDRGHLLLGARFGGERWPSITFWLGGNGADPEETIDAVENASDEEVGRLVPEVDGQQRFGTLGIDLRHDRHDPTTPWRKGYGGALALRSYRPEDGDRFSRLDGDISLALPAPLRSGLGFGLRGSTSDPRTPYYLRPWFGGTQSVRGFRDASLSGPLGARSQWSASAEWRVPIMPKESDDPRVIGVAFSDVGQYWDANGGRQDVVLGVGYGLRIRVPWIQIFSIDVGVPLTPEKTDDAFWVHTQLGFGF